VVSSGPLIEEVETWLLPANYADLSSLASTPLGASLATWPKAQLRCDLNAESGALRRERTRKVAARKARHGRCEAARIG
jgi:hypothetical protein